MRITYKILSLIATVILAWWGLRELINKVPPIGKRWWAIIILLATLIVLLILIGIIKRFHERTVSKIYEDNAGITNEYADSTAKIQLWTLFKGRYDVLHSLLSNRRWDHSTATLARSEVEYAEAEFRGIIQDRLGPDWVDDYLGRLGDIPDTVSGQEDRMQAHSNQFHRLIQAELGHQRSIAAKANEQKEAVLEPLSSK